MLLKDVICEEVVYLD